MKIKILFLMLVLVGVGTAHPNVHDYGDALAKSILFFEAQRSGKLPDTQRLTWRKDSALRDGLDVGVDLTGGYYDAGDNVKYNFPMAFTTTMLAWGVIEYGKSMGTELPHALEAVRWSTDYFLKSTANVTAGVVYAQVGDPNDDHNCWQRPEDMDTLRTVYAVNRSSPGSEVSAEMAAALAAASIAFKSFGDKKYADVLLERASQVFEFADTYRGSYNTSIGEGACPFYCDYSGYEDELLWAAAWLQRATKSSVYLNYVKQNIINFKPKIEPSILEFGWDSKHAGINVLLSKLVLKDPTMESTTPFLSYADDFICSTLPDSPIKSVQYSLGGLLYKPGGCNMQHTTAISFLVITYTRYLKKSKHVIQCGDKRITQRQLVQFTKSQVDYILGSNPLNMSYMVGYGSKFPQRSHHRGSSLPSVVVHPDHIACHDGTPYFSSPGPNPNQLTGAIAGGPGLNDSFGDLRMDAASSEPTTYVNGNIVGLLAYFTQRHSR